MSLLALWRFLLGARGKINGLLGARRSPRALDGVPPSGGVMGKLLMTLLVGCAATTLPPNHPAFDGAETESWLAYQVDGVDREDLLPAFQAGARHHGCTTEKLGSQTSPNIGGERRSYHGIGASCDGGEISLISLVGGRVRIGCAKPTTREDCDRLLRTISSP